MNGIEAHLSDFYALANVALLTAIFFRLGGLTKAHDDFNRRLDRIETGSKPQEG